MVCNLAEFGRTPKVNPAGGRDHWPQCFTVYFAGGGVQGGRAIGRSDPMGGVPAERPDDAGRSRGDDLPQPGLRLGEASARAGGPSVSAGRLRHP